MTSLNFTQKSAASAHAPSARRPLLHMYIIVLMLSTECVLANNAFSSDHTRILFASRPASTAVRV